VATEAEPASTPILAARLPEDIVTTESVPGPVHARVLFQAAHNRLRVGETRQFRRLLDAHRSLLHRRNAEVERTVRDHAGNVKLKLRFADGAAVETVVLFDPGSGDGAGAVFAAARIFAHPHGPEIPFKRITVSTCGIPAGIDRLTSESFLAHLPGARPRLAVSLVTADPMLRADLMPGATRLAGGAGSGRAADAGGRGTANAGAAEAPAPPADVATAALENLRAAVTRYLERTGRPVTFEVPVLGGVNDSEEDAAAVCRFLGSLPRSDRCDVNLIPWNRVEGVPFEPPADAAVSAFAARILAGGYPVTGRFPRGRSIAAACGQLGESVSPLSRRRQP
jgi:adenine C2-methylase RlmN of 23S rRNA A2503 and tRNA A37